MVNFLNVPELNFSAALTRLVTEYNRKPVLTRPQHRFFTDGLTYFEIDIDVHVFGYVARKGLSMLRYRPTGHRPHTRPSIAQLACDIGFTIEVRFVMFQFYATTLFVATSRTRPLPPLA
jgi:hypothetical protein